MGGGSVASLRWRSILRMTRPWVYGSDEAQGALLRGGMLPKAYVYPAEMRATRDLLRRRMHLMHKRSELLSHVQNTNSQYNLPEIGKKIAYKANREGVAERFADPAVQKNIEVDLALITYYDELLKDLELYILKIAKQHDANTLYLLQTVPGIGKILSLVLLYEIHRIERFPSVQEFASYGRLVKCGKESGGKRLGTAGKKSVTLTSSGPFLKPPRCFYATTSRGKSFWPAWRKNMTKAKP